MMTRMNRIDIYDKSVVRNNLNDENIQNGTRASRMLIWFWAQQFFYFTQPNYSQMVSK